jgi:hypothetical protein
MIIVVLKEMGTSIIRIIIIARIIAIVLIITGIGSVVVVVARVRVRVSDAILIRCIKSIKRIGGPHTLHLLDQSVVAQFHCIFGSACDRPGNHGPLVPVLVVKSEEIPVLIIGEWSVDESGIEVVVPSLATLLGSSSGHVNRDLSPVLVTLGNQINQSTILVFAPTTLYYSWF